MNANEALHWMEHDTGIMSCNDKAWPVVLRALRLLAAAEANGGERSQLIEELRTEADLCRNETADDVADLLDDAASSLVAISAMANALKAERDALKRHAEAMADAIQFGDMAILTVAKAAADSYRSDYPKDPK